MTFVRNLGLVFRWITQDLSEEERVGAWKAIVRSCLSLVLVVFVVHVMVSHGMLERWLPGSSFVTVAIAGDRIQEKVDESLEPVVRSLKEVKDTQQRTTDEISRLSKHVNLSLRRDIQSRLRDRKREWCTSDSSAKRERLLEEIDELQTQHRLITSTSDVPGGVFYPIPECSEL